VPLGDVEDRPFSTVILGSGLFVPGPVYHGAITKVSMMRMRAKT